MLMCFLLNALYYEYSVLLFHYVDTTTHTVVQSAATTIILLW